MTPWNELQKEEVVRKCSIKKDLLKIFYKIQWKTSLLESNIFVKSTLREQLWCMLLYKKFIFVNFFVQEKVNKNFSNFLV